MKNLKKLKEKTILLVEDEIVIRNNIASMLKFFFKEVYIAIDGYDALDKYEQNLPDIVMTDLKMPNMNGLELVEELKMRFSKAYIIIVSAHTDTDLLIDSIHNGVDRYIIKPVIEDELFKTFLSYLKKIDKEEPKIIELSESINIDLDKHLIVNKDKKIHLNNKEYELLKLLCVDMDKTITYEEIEYQIWGSTSMSLSALRSVVRDLRKKIGSEYILNVSGIGYRIR